MSRSDFNSLNIKDLYRNTGGRVMVRKFGANTAISTQEGIWDAGGAFNFPTAYETVRIKAGGNIADVDTTGAGARTVTIEYLDENFEEQIETLSTAGASASSATTGLVSRIQRAYVSSTGTYGGSNTGAITIENTTSLQVLAQINAGNGQTEHGAFCVPANKTAYIVRYAIDVGNGNTADVFLYRRDNADDVTAPYSPKRLKVAYYDLAQPFTKELSAFIELPEKTDIWFEAVKNTGGGDASVSVNWDMVLVDD